MSLLNYNLARIPDDLLDFLSEESTIDFMTILLCAVVYWGGTAVWIYLIAFVFHWSVTMTLWVITTVPGVLILPQTARSGIYYADAGSARKQSWIMLTGPPGLFRIAALLIFFRLRVGSTNLLLQRIDRWGSDSDWADIFKEEAANHEKKKFKYLLKYLWKMANKRIEII